MIGHILIVLLFLSIPPLPIPPHREFASPIGKRCVKRQRRDRNRFVPMSKASPGNKGFTLVEIVITLMIIGILAAIAIPAYTNYIDRSLVKLTIKNIRILEQSIKAFEFENMRLPNSLNEVGSVELLGANGNSITQSPPSSTPMATRIDT